MKTSLLGILLSAFFISQAALGQLPRTTTPEGASVYIIAPEDGATITGEVTIQFGLKGMGIAPAGIDVPNTGHHHLLINVDDLPAFDMPLPADDHHVHFGKGQTETTLQLPPGTYTLQLIVGDKNHIPFDPPLLSDKITITIE